ncbi:MAG TPA: transcriptional regulator [Streptosporangiaceae bacterium]
MYDRTVRRRALTLMSSGLTLSEVSRRTGVSRAALKVWRDNPEAALRPKMGATCPRCDERPRPPEPLPGYAYLLGLYLGDGCISPVGLASKKVWSLRIICADAWPGLRDECVEAILAIRPDNKVRLLQKQGCTEVNSYSKHWPCLFPQHGAGVKHRRKIQLQAWQQTIVTEHAGRFVRGLIHSDGSRFTNRVRRALPTGDRWYEYPRYLFSNESADIRNLFTDALDTLGIEWRYSRSNTISVARREAVARLDEFVGPKY